MKQRISPSCNQKGFSLLESLVGLLIFSIIVLGSGTAISRLLHVQKDMNIDSIVISTMQTRLQNALSSSQTTDLCNAINLQKINIAQTDFFLGCALENISVESTQVSWPVLAASKTSQSQAQSCAEGLAASDCYIVGR